MDADIEDEAYHSGLTLSDEDGKHSAGKEVRGSSLEAGTPPKERNAMNIGDTLLGGGSRKPQASAEVAIKPTLVSNPKNLTVANAMTPTTRLAGQLGSISFKAMEGKFSTQADSPTSDYASGNFSSLAESDRDYASMPSMTSLEKPDQSVIPAIKKHVWISGDSIGEEMDVDTVTDKPNSKIDIQSTALLTGKVPTRTLSESSSLVSESSSLSPAPLSMLTPSPASVPAIAEDIEIVTDSVSSERLRQDGVPSKRSAAGLLESDLPPSSKNPRLSPEVLGKRAIRVSTIVSPPPEHLSPRPAKRKGHNMDHSPTPSPSVSPRPAMVPTLTTSDASKIERVFQPTLSLPMHNVSLSSSSGFKNFFHLIVQQQQMQQQQQQQQQQIQQQQQQQSKPPRVDFTDIQAMSKSDRPLGKRTQLMTVDNRSQQVMVEGESSTMQTLERPKPAGSPIPVTSPMHVGNLISPHSSRQPSSSPVRSRSLSPHSPRMDISNGKGQDRKQEEKGQVQSRGGNNMIPQQNALLKVTEAHLAILPDEDGDTPLHLAIIHENVSLTRYIIHLVKGVDAHTNLDMPNNMRQTPLHLAVITKQPEMVQILLEAGASVSYPDRKGNSAIHLAVTRRDVKILEILAKSSSPRSDFNGKNFAGLTSIHLATKEAGIDVLKFLFQIGANKNASDSCSGRTPLHYAVEAENFNLVNFLLENSCDVNAPTFAGNTPLHVAAGRRLKEIVALLMAYGANPALANGEGDFPSDLPASLLMQRAKLNANTHTN